MDPEKERTSNVEVPERTTGHRHGVVTDAPGFLLRRSAFGVHGVVTDAPGFLLRRSAFYVLSSPGAENLDVGKKSRYLQILYAQNNRVAVRPPSRLCPSPHTSCRTRIRVPGAEIKGFPDAVPSWPRLLYRQEPCFFYGLPQGTGTLSTLAIQEWRDEGV